MARRVNAPLPQMLELVRYLVVFGMYSLVELTALMPILTRCLDTPTGPSATDSPSLVRRFAMGSWIRCSAR